VVFNERKIASFMTDWQWLPMHKAMDSIEKPLALR
jgi:hypothetical protein